MSEVEKLTTEIGELVSMEIDEVEKVEYTKENDKLVAFIIFMKSGKKYLLAISEVA